MMKAVKGCERLVKAVPAKVWKAGNQVFVFAGGFGNQRLDIFRAKVSDQHRMNVSHVCVKLPQESWLAQNIINTSRNSRANPKIGVRAYARTPIFGVIPAISRSTDNRQMR